MDYIKQLEELVKNDISVEINETIKEIEAELAKKKDKDLKEELQYMKQVKQYFDEVLVDIENNTISQEEALDILEGLEDMRIENQEV
ncbi:hypothetical protein [Halarcobacter bivalviorum]|uniref:Uncharacterized protein n=1 Tax=Halarcobacter bivalviorum TaxID=663364 RepID=A0AAX2ACF1_9BACT|nr:hypothetical protein [Halarcobacter bivalviorum]AXH11982.1 hypothetical protein ABIV_0976 [Halarcobacter bivalviorum]RXK07294.1 hypothetical protein CRU97_04075 [Halarcobacter bivalviorum]RXK11099.1 hypothetical protein CRV05_01655 [Halarcobacter bivalviorum]